MKPMTAYVETVDAAATKIFSLYKENTWKYNLPSILLLLSFMIPKLVRHYRLWQGFI
jgi:hypothetical protein